MTKRSNQIRAFVGPRVTSFTLARRMTVKHNSTEKACAAGHVERRQASTGQCLACLRTRQSRLYSENAKSLCEKAKSWRSKNPVKVAETNKAWRRANTPDSNLRRIGTRLLNVGRVTQHPLLRFAQNVAPLNYKLRRNGSGSLMNL